MLSEALRIIKDSTNKLINCKYLYKFFKNFQSNSTSNMMPIHTVSFSISICKTIISPIYFSSLNTALLIIFLRNFTSSFHCQLIKYNNGIIRVHSRRHVNLNHCIETIAKISHFKHSTS